MNKKLLNRTENTKLKERVGEMRKNDPYKRLMSFSKLGKGWDHGCGDSIDIKDLKWVEYLFKNQYPKNLPQPEFDPSPLDWVAAVWEKGEDSMHLEMDVKNKKGEFFILDNSGKGINIEDIDLTDSKNRKMIFNHVRNFFN